MKKPHFISTLLSLVLLFHISTNAHAACKFERDIIGEEVAIGVMLHWTTSFEENNSLFIVEKSIDGLDFTNLGAVKAIGNSKESNQYSFLDHSGNKEKTFYRLRQVNLNGTYSFSKVLVLQKENTNQFMVAHTSDVMAKDIFEVSLDSKIDANLQYTLKDWKGNTLDIVDQPVSEGLNTFEVNLNDLNEAIYKIELKIGEEVETLTFKKIKDNKAEKQNIANANKEK